MWNEIVARAVVAERVAVATRAARGQRLVAPAQARPAPSRRRRWGVHLPIYSAGRRATSPGTTPA
jgi:hypothetical protein